jgi:hypothetical protein
MELQRTQGTKKSGFGDDGWNMPNSSTSTTISGSNISHLKEEQKLWEPLLQRYEEGNFLDQTKKTWQ